ncbi:MAG: hypothetical protein ACK47B_09485 [Armatimonadota bacterium]
MTMRRTILLAAVALSTAAGAAAYGLGQEKPQPKAPAIAGDWTGTWGLYAPEGAPKRPEAAIRLPLTCKVEESKPGEWDATFEGEAGQPYKYRIKMAGRQAGGAVLFKGTVDLGPKDGGVYDWIGRANEKEFLGFYTSEGYVGTFQLARPK